MTPLDGAIRVIGIGNELRRDDGVGPVVARALAETPLGDDVVVADYGTRAVHLAFDLLDVTGPTVFVDAISLGDAPGTVTLVEEDMDRLVARSTGASTGHDIDLTGAIGALHHLGGRLDRILVVGIEPADITDGVGLSPAVHAAVPVALDMVKTVVQDLRQSPTAVQS